MEGKGGDAGIGRVDIRGKEHWERGEEGRLRKRGEDAWRIEPLC